MRAIGPRWRFAHQNTIGRLRPPQSWVKEGKRRDQPLVPRAVGIHAIL